MRSKKKKTVTDNWRAWTISADEQLEIKGMPAEGEPSVGLGEIGKDIGEPIKEKDIDICHRVPEQKWSEKKNTVVRFVRQCKKTTTLDKGK